MRKRTDSKVSALLLLTFALTMVQAIWSQATNGSIVGTVKDSSGAAVVGATVTVTDTDTGVSAKVVTTSTGDYSVPYLKPSNHYKVVGEMTGFQKQEVHGITLQIDQIVRADLTLKPGSESETVTVSAEALTLDTDSSSVGQVITQQQIVDLPLDNRSMSNLLLLAPGAVTTVVNNIMGSGPNNAYTINLGGTRFDSQYYTVDGIPGTTPIYQATAFSLSLDAMQEFKEQLDTYSASYGEAAAQVNVNSRSGTNSFHGEAWEFVRNDAFDSYGFFDDKSAAKPPLRQNQYGYSVGGPVWIPKLYNGHNRTFFFANLDYQTSKTSQTVYSMTGTAENFEGIVNSTYVDSTSGETVIVPVLNPATGEPFPNDGNGNYTIDKSLWARLATVANATQGRYWPTPLANGKLVNNGSANSVQVVSNPLSGPQQTYRIDETLGAKDAFMGRITFGNLNQTEAGATSLDSIIEPSKYHNWGVSETHTFTPNVINQVRVGELYYLTGSTGVAAPSADIAGLGLQNTYSQNGASFPNVQLSGFSSIGANNVPNLPFGSVWHGDESISWAHGKHTLGFGFGADFSYLNQPNGTLPLGRYTFDGSATAPSGSTPTIGNEWADYLLGDIVSGEAIVPTPYSPTSLLSLYIDQRKLFGFVNDDWKATSHLTFNLGVRWDYQGNPYEEKNHWFWLDSAATNGGLCTADKSLITSGIGGTLYRYCGSNTPPGAYKMPLAPRVGFAYSPGSGKWVVRGGWGVFFDQYQLAETSSGALYPYTESYNPAHQNFDDLYPTIPAATPVTSSDLSFIAVLQPNQYKDPYVENFTLSVQRQLARNTTLDVAYVGNAGRKLETRLQISQPTSLGVYPLTNFGGASSPGTVIGGGFVASSNYNSLQAKFEHRTKDAVILSTFAWSSAMDDASGAAGAGLDNSAWAGPMDAHNIHLDYAKSSFDVNRKYMLSFVYQLPFGRGKRFGNGLNKAVDSIVGGWQMNGIYTAQSGIPFNLYCTDIGGDLQSYGQRCNRVGNPYPSDFHQNYQHWFDWAAYAQPAEGVFGNEHRNDLRAPGLNNLDFSLFKNFQLPEGMAFQMRAETFNTFNHTQFGQPNPYYSSSASTTTSVISSLFESSRIVQLAGKFTF